MLLVAFNVCCYTGQTFLSKLYSNAYKGAAADATP